MKYILLLLFTVLTLGLGACAHHDTATTQSYQSTSTRGYSK